MWSDLSFHLPLSPRDDLLWLTPSRSYKDQRLSDINEGLGAKFSFYGWYAQLPETGEWDGSQLLEVKDDLKASGAIFQPAVMPNKHK